MNAYLRTLRLSGAVRPVREHGASALDRAVVAWPAPDPAARVLDRWGMRIKPSVGQALIAPWPAPDPLMRFDLPAPQVSAALAPIDGHIPWTNLVEPSAAVRVPDLRSASLAAVAPPIEARIPHPWPAPTPADAAPLAAGSDRKSFPARVVVGLAVAASALAVGAAALFTVL